MNRCMIQKILTQERNVEERGVKLLWVVVENIDVLPFQPFL